MDKYGTLEWVEKGKVVRKEFAAIVIEYSSGIISSPQYFHGRMILATDTTEKPLLVLAKGSQLANHGVIRRGRWWNPGRFIINQRVGLFAWAVLLIVAIVRNLRHFFGF
jgi:hypothetical protein